MAKNRVSDQEFSPVFFLKFSDTKKFSDVLQIIIAINPALCDPSQQVLASYKSIRQ